MANRYFKQFALVAKRRTITLSGKIVLNASGAVVSNNIDFVQSVTKTGTGLYTVVLADAYVATKAITVSHVGTAADVAKVSADTVASNKSFVIATVVSGAVANVSTACEIHVLITLHDAK